MPRPISNLLSSWSLPPGDLDDCILTRLACSCRRLSNASAWNDRHRWSLAFGALVACMLAGYLGSHTWPAIDLAAKAVLNVAAVERMIALARVVWRRT